MKRIATLTLTLLWISLAATAPDAQTVVTFTGPEMLGRPTDHSVTVNVVADAAIEAYFESGVAPGVYTSQTPVVSAQANSPIEAVIDGLASGTRYYYRMVYRRASGSWTYRDEHSFRTQRPSGSAFTFTVISDSHLGQYGGQTADERALYRRTLLNAGADEPDFHIDLGDTAAMDPQPLGTGMTAAEADAAYLIQRPDMGLISGSVPVFLAVGNHENEEGWNFDDTFTPPDQSLAVVGITARKKYFPNPVPDSFYSGNDDPLPSAMGGDTNREDYFSWEWGDALFVVLDPYHYSRVWPSEGNSYGGEGQDGEPGGDRWDWSLGIKQYLWLKSTLEGSNARYKFVFSHHVTGGATPYGRGGVSAATFFEWGGRNADGTWGWDVERPASEGWDVPVHQLMVASGVTAYIHGHDHIYAREALDGIVYLEVPKPDDAGYAWEPYGYGHTEGLYEDAIVELTNSGHVRVSVSPSGVTFDYVRSYLPGDGTNGTIADTLTIPGDPVETHPPDQPALVAPADGSTNVSKTPVLKAAATDPDGDVLDVTFYIRNEGGTFASIGTVTGMSSGGTASVASSLLSPDTRYEWYVNVSDRSRTTTGPVWSFTTENVPVVYYDLTTAVGAGGGGTTQPPAGVHSYVENSTVEIRAIPSTGYAFGHWEGDVASPTSAVTSVLLNGNKTVVAHFIENVAKFEFGVVEAGAAYTTVSLTKTYASPVVVSTSRYSNNSAPVVTRISNVTSTSFRIRLQNPSGGSPSPETISYLVVEQGAWDVDGVRFEAQTYLSSVTDQDGSWVGESRTYGQSYVSPVVVGQVMSENDSRWSAFWCQGSSRTTPPSATVLKTGKMVGEDSVVTRANETIGVIVFEAGHGTLGGIEFEAALGSSTVQGAVDAPPYVYNFTAPFVTAPRAVVTAIAGMNGPNGAWAQLHGAAPMTTTTLSLSVDEDQIGDSERNHLAERVGYVAFGPSAGNAPPVAGNDSGTVPEDTPVAIDVLANDTDADGDVLTFVIATQPSHGTAAKDGTNAVYTPAADFCGNDSFTYTASDGNGGSGAGVVNVTVACVNDAPVSTGQSVSTPVDNAVSIVLSASDADGDPLTYTIRSKPAMGSLRGGGADWAYTPQAGYTGADSLTFSASDGQADSNVSTVSITVVPAPASLSTMSLNPTSVRGGSSSTGTVTLTSPAPAGGVNVTLSDNSTYASTPGSVTVPEGSLSATFNITTRHVFRESIATIAVSCNGVVRTAILSMTR